MNTRNPTTTRTSEAQALGLDQVRDRLPKWEEIRARLHAADADALRNRLRLQAAPWAVAAAVTAIGLIQELAIHACGGDRTAVVLPSAAATGAAIAATLAVLRSRLTAAWAWLSEVRAWVAAHPVRALVCASAAWVWLLAAALAGPQAWEQLLAAGLGALYALAAHWWRTHRIGYPATHTDPDQPAEPVTETTVEPVEEGESDPIVRRWADYIAGPQGVLPDTYLSGATETPTGTAYRLHLVPGKHTLTTAINALPRISSGLGRGQTNLIISARPPSREDPDPDPAVLELQVVTNSPIKDTVFLDRPTFDAGRGAVLLGPYADGSGWAPWRMYSENSGWGGFVVGGMGSGKSGLLESLAYSAMASGTTVVWYLDPQGGTSSPALADQADWAVLNPEHWEAYYEAVADIVHYRSKENSVEGWSGFTPSPERPGLMVIIDECHEVWADKNLAKKWGKIARISRKVGVMIIGASQIYTVDTFGGDRALRSAMTKGNVVIMRTTESVDAQLIPGFAADPSALPEMPGYGYTIASAELGGRTAPFRVAWQPSSEAVARKVGLPEADSIRARMAALEGRAVLDEIASAAAGEAYARRREIHTADREAARRELDELRAGRRAKKSTTAKPAAATAAVEEEEYADVPVFPAALTLAPVQEAEPEGLTGLRRRVYDVIVAGVTQTGDIEAATGGSKRGVRNALIWLEANRYIANPARGVYALAASPQRATA
ncbi:DNA/RNA helicase domain-containing protein [Marinactinospora rubrisoli]|uniref:DNA/RNA helicase domain-containing protein n=1 Tax=Marinactinospora rubrisoli TaxID=2715399 RepID=A0ABW2KNL4_9ACTN